MLRLGTAAVLVGSLLAATPTPAAADALTERVLRLPAASMVVPSGVRLVGVRWVGPRDAVIRIRVGSGPWTPVEVLAARGAEWVSDPVWLGGARRIELEAPATVRRAVVELITPGADPPVTTAAATPRAAAPGGVAQPLIHPRSAWGADESLRHRPPVGFARLHVIFVHHTASGNGYAESDVPAMIRSIYAYHVRTLGWWDVGYNYLVDAYGGIWEGRAGGIDRNIRGAHTEGFNSGAAGIALIGTYSATAPSASQLDSLESLIAWRLDLAHVDPSSRQQLLSAGTAKFPAGQVATFDAISGHRDAVYTDCPGGAAYGLLPQVRRDVAALTRLRVYAPSVTPATLDQAAGPFPLRFHATLSRTAAWHVAILDPAGVELRGFDGLGRTVDARWDGTMGDYGAAAPLSSLRWRITAGDAGDAARPAAGRFDDLATPDLVGLMRTATVAARADGWSVRIALRAAARVSIGVTDATGSAIRVLRPAHRSSGSTATGWDGTDEAGSMLPSGRYAATIRVAVGRLVATRTVPLAIRRGIASIAVAPALLGAAPGATAEVTLIRREAVATTVALVARSGATTTIATLPAGPPGTTTLTVDGVGLRDGHYVVRAVAATAGGSQVVTAPLVIDRRAPVLRNAQIRRARTRVVISGRLSETAAIVVRAGKRIVWRGRLGRGPVDLSVALAALRSARTLEVDLVDRVGNVARPLAVVVPRRRQ